MGVTPWWRLKMLVDSKYSMKSEREELKGNLYRLKYRLERCKNRQLRGRGGEQLQREITKYESDVITAKEKYSTCKKKIKETKTSMKAVVRTFKTQTTQYQSILDRNDFLTLRAAALMSENIVIYFAAGRLDANRLHIINRAFKKWKFRVDEYKLYKLTKNANGITILDANEEERERFHFFRQRPEDSDDADDGDHEDSDDADDGDHEDSDDGDSDDADDADQEDSDDADDGDYVNTDGHQFNVNNVQEIADEGGVRGGGAVNSHIYFSD